MFFTKDTWTHMVMPLYAEAFTVVQRCGFMFAPRCTATCVCMCHLMEGSGKVSQQQCKIQPFSCPQLVGLVAWVCPVVTRTVAAGAQDPTVANTIWPSPKLPMGRRLQGAAGLV